MIIVTLNGKLTEPKTKHLKLGKVFLDEGVNYLDEVVYQKLKKHPYYNDFVKKGILSVIDEAKKTTVKKKKETVVEISKLSLEDAKAIASAETDKKKLNRWLTEEQSKQNRAEVLAVLRANLTGKTP
jgi:hypothetical protein